MKEQWKRWLRMYKEQKKWIRTAGIVLVMIAAVVVFGDYGEKDEIPIQFPQEQEEAEGKTVSQDETGAKDKEGEKIYVDISGQVKNPGVYSVDEGTRLFEVIEEAGGLLSSAETDQINRAEIVTDGQKVVIPEEGTMEEGQISAGVTVDGRININTADSSTLQEISGVGPATAEKIIAYRTTNGRFRAPEDLKNVSGIGDKTFEKIKDKITI